jgi:outer membrane protein insertion porin family
LPTLVAGAASSQILPSATRPARAKTTAPLPKQVQGDRIAAIVVTGNQRIEAGTIQSYMLLSDGDAFDPKLIDQSLKTLYATGLFSNVGITRQGNNLVVNVV